jgi:hypothetical protein
MRFDEELMGVPSLLGARRSADGTVDHEANEASAPIAVARARKEYLLAIGAHACLPDRV